MSCQLCPLHESALVTNCMKGEGPDGAEIMLVGSGPGGYEDAAGRPFIGKSGRYLDAMLADAGIDRAKSFVTNATRCRPPLVNKKERAPTPDEINTCRRYLIEEVQRVRPKAIIALGDAALRALCKTSGVKAKRGQSFELHPEFGYACPVFVTYHPAAVMRTQPLRTTVVPDLRRARDRHRPPDPIDWTRHGGIGFASGPIAYDIETIDESGAIVEAPTQVAFAYGDEPVVIFDEPLDICGKLASILEDPRSPEDPPNPHLVSHFGWDFDDEKTGLQSTRDTAALAYLDDENQPLGLESLCVKYLGVRGWKETRDGAALGSDALAEYNARDARNTLLLHDVLCDRLGDRVRIADAILLPARLALTACSQRGLRIDLPAVLTARAGFADEIMETRVRCRVVANDAQLNPGSYPQVALALRGRGHELPATDHGNDATGKAILQELHDPLADAVLEYRTAVKADSTYGKPYEQAARSPDQRMRSHYTVIRTVTGRTSSQAHPRYDPSTNVQNLPRNLHHFLKDVVIADYSGIEFRIAAWLARERTILDNYCADPKWDPHKFFAAQLYGIPEAQVQTTGANSQRQIAKSGNFSQLYLGSADTLVEYGKRIGVDIGMFTARKVHQAFRRIYPGFVPWWASILEEVQTYGYVQSPTGRRRHFGDYKLIHASERLSVWREAVNMPVQSLTADLALLGLDCCHRAGMPINGFFHDAISFDLTGKWDCSVEHIRYCMVDEPLSILREQFGVDITIPIEVDIKVQ
ncbi:MAG: DNA polymerase [Candidatus Cybelea sp.]